MKRPLIIFLLISAAISLPGCAGWLKDRQQENTLVRSYEELAMSAEKSGKVRQALLYWQLVHELNPTDENASARIAELKTTAGQRAAKHFKNGIAAYEKGLLQMARKEFLIVLTYDPDHKDALDYLKNRFTHDRYLSYKVMGGDTAEAIATKVYKDPSKAFLVAYFMDLNAKARPVPGRVVRLPVVPRIDEKRSVDIQKDLAQARTFFRKKHYEKALGASKQVLKCDPENNKAIDLKNASYFQMGRQLELKGDYPGALNMYQQVDPTYDGIDSVLAALKKDMQTRSELHYRNGVKYFVNEELEKAIAEWEKTLALNPDHQKAKADIQKAKGLLEKLKKIN